jgi:hypothetical protein
LDFYFFFLSFLSLAEITESNLVTQGANCVPCGGNGGSGVTTYTDEELQIMGQNVGCQLATSNKGASLASVIVGYQTVNGVQQPIYGPGGFYALYLNTINSQTAPESYKDGVRAGWADCFSRGEPAANICRDIVIYSGPRGFQTVNYCNWIGVNNPRTAIQ